MEENRYKIQEHKGMTIQMLQQQPPTIQQRKPILLNGQLPQMFNQQGNIMDNIPKTVHTLIHDSSGVHFQPAQQPQSVLQFQPQQQQQQQQIQTTLQKGTHTMDATNSTVSTTTVSNLWLLVEWEADGENIYHVINASELIGNNSGTIQTGKSVWFKNGSVIIQATIVLISDDKVYIDRELNDLRKMAAQNLAENNKKRLSNGRNSNSISNGQKDKTIVPRTSQVKQQDVRTGYSKPMTFDQQTQTDTRMSGSQGNAVNEELMRKMDDMINKQEQTSKMLEKLMSQVWTLFDQTSSNNRTVSDLSVQVNRIENFIKGNTSDSDIMIPKPVEEQKTQFIFYDNQNESNISKANSEGNLVIAEYEHGANGELIKRPQSRVSYNNDATNQSSFSTDGSEFVLTESRANSTVITLNTSKTSKRNENKRRSTNNSNNVSATLDDWKDEENDGFVLIGPGRTKVPSNVYHSLDWSSYKAATRKLLITLFPREILATHSLTGRPSPAFHDRNRPAKDRLDQIVIGDIVYTVTKHCDVPESLVRTAITTKCADENKMSRQRLQKRKIKDEAEEPFSKIPHYDKENSISMSNN